ncbi:MAG: amidophosphoribosyltransferase [Opitutales bacterium]
MSDSIKHECGIAMVRLLKPLAHYQEKYGSPLYGLNKLFLLMEKQHNRGQDGAGLAAMKLGVPPGKPYIFRKRNIKSNPLDRIFRKLLQNYAELVQAGTVHPEFPATVKEHFDFGAEVYMGHLRYGTYGDYGLSACHPYFRKSNWPSKNLVIAGNFTLTNTPYLRENLVEMGQHPIYDTDTQTLLEKIGYHLDAEHDRLYAELTEQGYSGTEIARLIGEAIDPAEVIARASRKWDGGYSLIGMIGSGDVFALRDPCGIRPCYYYRDEKDHEVVAVASERAPLMTVFGIDADDVREIEPGQALVIRKNGEVSTSNFARPLKRSSCSFERIYFSRGNDPDIYQERKALGGALTEQILKCIDYDLENAVFGFVPNTAETAYYGMMENLRLRRRQEVKEAILEASRKGEVTEALLDSLIMNNWPRGEKIAHKDIKLRTFISQEKWRKDLASHIYDVSYGTVRPNDVLVCIDDSIVRGTTLRQSILKILARLNPRKIIIASTAPQIRYPDFYGIDMAEFRKFIAFEAAIFLLKERGMSDVIVDVYQRCLEEVKKPSGEIQNQVKKIYAPFSPEEISAKISELVTPRLDTWKGEVEIVFQNIWNLHKAVPGHTGDWYFTGDYPTPEGYRVVNKAFINYYENLDGRGY